MGGWVGGIGNEAQLRPAKLELGLGLSLAKSIEKREFLGQRSLFSVIIELI